MKQIIVEGPDGAGKSTLVQRLYEEFPFLNPMPSYKLMADAWTFSDYIAFAINPDAGGPVPPRIYDRLFYSELVYGPILRSKISLTPQEVRRARSYLGDTAFLVYCRLPYDLLTERVTQNPQLEGVIPNLNRIYRDYDVIIGDNAPRYWVRNAYAMYDQTEDAWTNLVSLLKQYLNS